MGQELSIIIPCRNGVNYLAEAVGGIRRQEANAEIILGDDGSTDGTAGLARSLGCLVRSIPPSGQPRAKNIGLSLAKRDFVLFHDHDDVLRPGALRHLLARLGDDTSLAGVMAQAKDFVSPELDAAAAGLVLLREPFIAMERRLHLSNVGRTRGKIMQFKGYAASVRNGLGLTAAGWV